MQVFRVGWMKSWNWCCRIASRNKLPTIFLRSIIIIEFQSSHWGFFNTKLFISSSKRRVLRCCDITGRMLKAYPLPFNTRCKQLHVAQASPFFNSKSSAFVWNSLLVANSLYVVIICVDILYVKVEINNEASALQYEGGGSCTTKSSI